MSEPFHPGQRWISTSEPELGLGEVREVSGRTVTMQFRAANERRQYVAQSAPLRRAAFRAGDTIRTRGGEQLLVSSVTEETGRLIYHGDGRDVPETDLSDTLSFSSPLERLYAGQFDPPAVFELRREALRHQQRYLRSETRGLLGGRIDLLPHQMSIAAEVTARLAPRVLLADEVGLGKTIEACLILHRLILTGRASRVLIVVPETLVHQWFLELLRRFSLWFHIFTEARCQAIEESHQGANPFLENQLVLCDLGLFLETPHRLEQALSAGWDLLVVDEAHHLQWSPAASTPAYEAVERLGHSIPGLLLLTATPEQLGIAGHFARLRLLDPARFHDLDTFIRETGDYLEVARRAEAEKDTHAPEWLEALLDRHGTGRVMFRNTRATVAGFPPRVARLHPLAADADASALGRSLAHEWAADRDTAADAAWRPNFTRDPRVAWLAALLRSLAGDKVLLICRSQRKAVALETALREIATVAAGSFHEGMTLIQRDRTAAWFADPDGARLLICSEIGSEGRNFQFAHHLVLFDLPLDPGLLEQRIGRLDRIGQASEIQVHVPYVSGSHLEVLARWYHEGLNAFAENAAGGRELMEQFAPAIVALAEPSGRKRVPLAEALPPLIAETRAARVDIAARLDRGRDRLLEWNSFKPEVAARLVTAIRAGDADESLDTFMLNVFDHYFIEVEQLAPRTYRLGSAGVLRDAFPGITSGTLTVTADRSRALLREEQQFLTWDHPLVSGAMDLLLGSEHGNCSAARWIDAAPGLFLEALYILECVAPPALDVERYLPPTPVRVVVDNRGQNAAAAISSASAAAFAAAPDVPGLLKRSEIRESLLPRMVERARLFADAQVDGLIQAARRDMALHLERETERLRSLQQVNRSVRDDEIARLVALQRDLDRHIGAARLRLDAVRVIRRGPEK